MNEEEEKRSNEIKKKIAKIKDFDGIYARGKYLRKKGEYYAIRNDSFNGIVGHFSRDELTAGGLGSGVSGIKMRNKRLILTELKCNHCEDMELLPDEECPKCGKESI